jgi:putative flavoprotein involved in K+ transport
MRDGEREQIDTLVIGGGQAGLAVGYHLSRRGVPFLIVDANERTGDAWRNRWDSLRLFTANKFSGMPGMPYPDQTWGFATKDQIADFLESYASHFELPIRHSVEVTRLTREGDHLVALIEDGEYEADNVVVAMSSYQEPTVPEFASELDPRIVQIHMVDYKNPDQLREGDVLVVGAGNSGAEIAFELAQRRHVLLSGPSTGQAPFRPERLSGRILIPILSRLILRVLNTSTPIGKRARPKILSRGAPLTRTKEKDLAKAGVERAGRTVGVVDGSPELDDGRVVDVSNVVWCNGFEPGFSWIDLPVFDKSGKVVHDRGVADAVPGLYFVGLRFLYSIASDTLLGVGRDADHVVGHISDRRSVLQTVS